MKHSFYSHGCTQEEDKGRYEVSVPSYFSQKSHFISLISESVKEQDACWGKVHQED